MVVDVTETPDGDRYMVKVSSRSGIGVWAEIWYTVYIVGWLHIRWIPMQNQVMCL